MQKSTLTLIALAALALTACGGYESAQKAYQLGEYNKAAGLFDDAFKGEQNEGRKAEEAFLLGECYRRLGLNNKAATAYQKAVRLKYEDDIAMLRLADAYRAIGKFDEARDMYSAYYERHRTDRRVGVGRESAQLAESVWPELSNIKTEGENTDSGYVVKPFKDVNSKYSDFCPVFVGDGYDVVYFSSLRMEKKKRRANKITGQGGSNIYMSKIDGKGKWTVPQPLDEPFGTTGNDDGVAYVSPDGHTMVFTRCPLNNQDGCPVHAYEVKREGGRWAEPVRIMPGADSTLMVAHPALSPDGQTLYFVSDKAEGGFGGLDVWKALRNVDGSWGPAQNLGAMVNTPGDEMFPSVREDGTLYFSSNGHKGFGGLDIFKASLDEGGRYFVTNMGMPINSAGDDFGITFMGTAEEGLFSSNRGNNKGYDDIYSFYLPPVILTIEARIGESGKKAFADGNTKPRSRVLRPSPSAAAPAKSVTAAAEPAPAAEPDEEEAKPQEEPLVAKADAPADAATVSGDAEQTDDVKSAQTTKAKTTKSQTTKGKTTTGKKTTTGTKKSSTSTTKGKTTTSGKKTTTTGAKKSSASTTKAKTTTTGQKSTASTGDKTTAKSSTSATKTTASKTTASKTSTQRKKSSTSKKRKFVPIPNAYVRIVGSNGTNVKLPVDDHGKVLFVAEKDVKYIILSGAPGYANTRTELSTEGLNRTQTIAMTSLLDKVE